MHHIPFVAIAAFFAGTAILYALLFLQRWQTNRKLKRNIKAWLPIALRNGPASVEYHFVKEWSAELGWNKRF